MGQLMVADARQRGQSGGPGLRRVPKRGTMFHVKHPRPGPELTVEDARAVILEIVGDAAPPGLAEEDATFAALLALARELCGPGAALGLTGYASPRAALGHLIAPALGALRWLAHQQELKVTEVGSGSGALGLTLAIVAPAWRVYLLDRREKATTFAEVVALRLGLRNAMAVKGDARQPPATVVNSDAAVFRAVDKPERDLDLARHLVSVGGKTIIWTSSTIPSPVRPQWQEIGRLQLAHVGLSVRAFERMGGA